MTAIPQNINDTASPGFTLRAAVVGLLMVAATCVLVCYAELVVAKIQIGFLQLPPVLVGMLVLLLTGRSLLMRWSARLGLAIHETFTIYVMMLLASMISSRGLLQKLIPLLIVPNYYATPENAWQSLFYGYIKRWSVPWDPAKGPKQPESVGFYASLQPGQDLPWAAWLGPLAAWGLFVAVMFFAYLCLAVLLRRQWVDNEKLSFPLVQLPLEMVRSSSSETGFMMNRLTWMGFAVPALVFGFNGLHQWYPSVPEITTQVNLNAFATTPPWNAMLFFSAFISFAAVGFFYLLPTDLLFSLWSLFLLTKVAEVTAASLGYQPEIMPMYGCLAFIGYQIIGCYVVMVGYMAWAARPHIARVWRSAFRLRDNSSEEELLSYRTAFWGLIAALLLSAGWLWALGMAYWLALFELATLMFIIAVVMARSTCESGMLMTETSFRPIDLYRMVGDVRNLGGANITCLAFLDALWMRDQRGLVLTGFLDSMKFADGVRVRRRSLLLVIPLAIVASVLIAGYLHVMLPYKLGAVRMYEYVYAGNPVWSFNDAANVLNRNRPPLPWIYTLNFLIGVVVTLGIVLLRSRTLWFPIHPLGYALCGTWTMMVFWFPCLIAWLIKVLILRYGGMRLYARARPFFLGMVLGEFTMAVIWTVPSLFWRTPTPAFPWP
jgi:hypothetical protein